jgi:UDP-N-acetylglucosamine/UDP-N-acetylgalactosamine 4-epimerase
MAAFSAGEAPLTAYQLSCRQVQQQPRRWLVTGAAGFIGSNLVETLLALGQEVVGLDNFATGRQETLADLQAAVLERSGPNAWQRFRFVAGDITDPAACAQAVEGVDYVLHQAALGSVPRSLHDPWASHRANVDGFLQMLIAARDAKVRRFVYASSSSVYGDSAQLPKVEAQVGAPLSPYALTKSIDEQYAAIFARSYGFDTVGLRYFNVFGRRQDPAGAYAAVIPRWVATLLRGEQCIINGDGETSRDFCYIANVVQANLLAALTPNDAAVNQVYNVAVGHRTTLNQLHRGLCQGLAALAPALAHLAAQEPAYGPFRAGDVRHSLASIDKAQELLGYEPTHTLEQGLAETLRWYYQTIAPALHG